MVLAAPFRRGTGRSLKLGWKYSTLKRYLCFEVIKAFLILQNVWALQLLRCFICLKFCFSGRKLVQMCSYENYFQPQEKTRSPATDGTVLIESPSRHHAVSLGLHAETAIHTRAVASFPICLENWSEENQWCFKGNRFTVLYRNMSTSKVTKHPHFSFRAAFVKL